MQKYFDSCVYTNNYDIESLSKLKKLCKKNYCKKAFLQIPKYKLKEIQSIKKNCEKTNFFYPIFHVKNKNYFKNQFKYFKKNNIKIVKIHPRFLNLDLKKEFRYYKKIFQYCENNSINIMFCSFASFDKKILDYNFLDLISKLLNITKKIKVIIMHTGGTQLLEFYERLRFKKNIILDLSYTAQHYLDTNLFNDIVFLIKNFDNKLIIGSDTPSKKILLTKKFLTKLKKVAPKRKIENIAYRNLQNLINEL